MTKIACPYKFPATSRREMARYIAFNRIPYYDHGEVFPLTYNVKVSGLNATFEILWNKWGVEMLRDYCGVKDPFVISELKPRLQHLYETTSSTSFEQAIEDARRSVTDGDTYNITWDGDKVHKVKYEFRGRQGGHLCVTEINGYNVKVSPHELYDMLMCVDYFSKPELREIYKLAVQWYSDFTQANAVAEVKYMLAWSLFVNVAERFLEEAA